MVDALAYCKVVAQFKGFVADSLDADDLPEFSTPTGTGKITPNVKMVRLGGETPKMFFPMPIDVTVDAEGNLSQGGRPYVMLLAPTAAMNPSNFAYSIVLNLKFGATSETFGPYTIVPVAGETVNLFDITLGTPGPTPVVVTRGKSLYESAVETGQFVGTEEEFVTYMMEGGGGGSTGTTYVEDPNNPGFFIPA